MKGDWRLQMRGWRLGMTLLALLMVFGIADARTPRPPPLRRVHHPLRSTLEIIPRQRTGVSTKTRSMLPITPHPSTLLPSDTLLLTVELPSLLPHSATLLLRPTEHLFHPNARITHGNGMQEPLKASEYKVYTGEVIHPNFASRAGWEELWGMRDGRGILGSARIMVHQHDDELIYEGSFDIHGESFNILTQEHYNRVKTPNDAESYGPLVIYRDADLSTPHTCHDDHPHNSNTSHPIYQTRDLFTPIKRDDLGGMTPSTNYGTTIGSTAGCPTTQQIVYMGVALDCNYISAYGTVDAARTQILNNFNQISALYRSTFNISLGIIELIVQNETCPTTAPSDALWNQGCNSNITLDERLSLFSQWRGNRGEDGVGLWHLMSACATDSEIGVAWLGTLCQTGSALQSGSYVSGTGISTATVTEWSLIAHEIGHGFGAIHDCTTGCTLQGYCCPASTTSCNAGGQYIMNPTTSSSELTFSPCTRGNICSNIGTRSISTSCIQTPGSQTIISLQQCGNGIVENGEECDPGSNATSPCCDSATCRFTTGSVCDPSNSACCTSTCQYASSGTVCRPAINSICDFPETCTGSNATCPEDRTADDGTSCGSNGLACASGTCTSLDLQCQTAGSDMNLTTACGQRDDTSCVVTCRDPRITNQCVVLQTPLVDGSPCGYGGHCYNQTCAAGSWQDTAGSWYRSNLQISIPVTIVAGLIALGIIILIIRCCFRGCTPRRQPARPVSTLPPPPPPRQSTYNPYSTAAMSQLPPPPPTRQSNHAQNGYPQNGYDGQNGYPQQNYNGYPQQGQWQQGPVDYSSPRMSGYGQGQGQGQAPAGGWVDESLYNGPNYGRREAYGR